MPPPDPGRRAVLSRDTDPVVERRQVSLWCRMSADARLESAAAACTETLRLSLAGIHTRAPHGGRHAGLLALARIRLGAGIGVSDLAGC